QGLLAEHLAGGAVEAEAEHRVLAAAGRRRRRRRAALGLLLLGVGLAGGGLADLLGALRGPVFADQQRRRQGVAQRQRGVVGRRRRRRAAASPRRGAGADVQAVGRHDDATHLRLRRLEEHEALALVVDAVDQPALVGAGVERAVRPQAQAEDVVLLAGVEDA